MQSSTALAAGARGGQPAAGGTVMTFLLAARRRPHAAGAASSGDLALSRVPPAAGVASASSFPSHMLASGVLRPPALPAALAGVLRCRPGAGRRGGRKGARQRVSSLEQVYSR